MHHLTDFTTLDNQSRLNSFLYRNQIMMDSTYSNKRRDGCMTVIDVAVGQDNIVDSTIHTCFSLFAQLVDTRSHTGFAFRFIKEDGKFFCVESFVSDVAEDIEFGVCQYWLRQTHHLAVRLVRCQDIHTHSSDVFGERHDELLANRVDWWVGHLGELLSEVVEQQLRTVGQNGQLGVVTH